MISKILISKFDSGALFRKQRDKAVKVIGLMINYGNNLKISKDLCHLLKPSQSKLHRKYSINKYQLK